MIAVIPFRPAAAGFLALLASAINIGAVVSLVRNFEPAAHGPTRSAPRVGYQFDTSRNWLTDIGSRFDIGVDGLSLLMVAMTAVVVICAIAYGLWEGRYRTRGYYALLLLLEAALMLLFVAHDLLVFYIGFEAMLIPLYFLMGIWGGADRRRATLKFVIYTFVGTLLMLVAIIYLGLQRAHASASTRSASRTRTGCSRPSCSRSPSSAPCSRSTAGCPTRTATRRRRWPRCSRAVASKAGAYGLLRIVLPIFPEPVATFRWWVVGAALIGAPVRLAAGVPPARRARRDRVLLDRPDGPDRARHLRADPQRRDRRRASRWSTTR